MEYLAFVLWCFGVAAAGGLVGLVLGNLRLPATLVIASSAAAGTGANLVISAAAALTASIAHIRAGRVNWRLFAWMAPPSVVGALVGGYLAGVVPDDAVLLGIAVVLVYSGIDLLRRKPAPRAADHELDLRAAALSGAAIGLLGGFVGLILGSLRMPALLRLVGEPASRAVGTNLAVGVCVGVAGLLGHLPSAAPDWKLIAVGGGASIPAALIGARLTGRLSEPQLIRAIGFVLLGAGAGAAIQAFV